MTISSVLGTAYHVCKCGVNSDIWPVGCKGPPWYLKRTVTIYTLLILLSECCLFLMHIEGSKAGWVALGSNSYDPKQARELILESSDWMCFKMFKYEFASFFWRNRAIFPASWRFIWIFDQRNRAVCLKLWKIHFSAAQAITSKQAWICASNRQRYSGEGLYASQGNNVYFKVDEG